VYAAVQCTDTSWPSLGQQLLDNWKTNAKAPFQTWGNFWFNAACLYWPAQYPGARLVAEPGGTTHAGTLYGNACVDDQIAAYIANGTLPARKPGYGADTYCAPLSRPAPIHSCSRRRGSRLSASGGWVSPSPPTWAERVTRSRQSTSGLTRTRLRY
jgi:hypothetical protein